MRYVLFAAGFLSVAVGLAYWLGRRENAKPRPIAIAEALKPYIDSRLAAGAVALVTDRDKTLSLDAVGFADVMARKEMRPDTLFWIASVTKPITATALMMLVEEGKVGLDDPVEKYIPEFHDARVGQTNERPTRPISIRDLLRHTSGLPFLCEAERPTLDALPLQEAVKIYAKTPLLFEPGSQYLYSNAGMNAVGRVIEVASGRSYEQFLDERLLGPLGMKDTTFWPNEEQVGRLAKSYKRNETIQDLEETAIYQFRYPLTDRRQRFPIPGSGLFSTASDLGAFGRMLLNEGELNGRRYLLAESLRELTRKQTPDRSEYGLGFATGGGSFGHGGAYSTCLMVDPKVGLAYIFMAQHFGVISNGETIESAFQKAGAAKFGRSAK